MIMRVC